MTVLAVADVNNRQRITCNIPASTLQFLERAAVEWHRTCDGQRLMKIAGDDGRLALGQMVRYVKMTAAVIILTVVAFSASRYLDMPLASFAALAFLLLLTKLSYFCWERWFLGRNAEARLNEALKAFSDEYRVLADVVLPDSKGNIDRLLVGPNGIFAIAAKSYSGCVMCDDDRWYLNGHALRSLSKQVKRNSLAVRSAIASLFTPPGDQIPYVTPLLVFVSSQTKLKLSNPTLPVLRLEELDDFIRDYQPKRTLSEYEQRSIVYHLQSLQPGFEDTLEAIDAAEHDKKIA